MHRENASVPFNAHLVLNWTLACLLNVTPIFFDCIQSIVPIYIHNLVNYKDHLAPRVNWALACLLNVTSIFFDCIKSIVPICIHNLVNYKD